MSNQSISSSEFQRFQDQLISLKESKYKTEEKCEYLIRNISQLELKCTNLERELSKANDLKNKFKSAKDMDMLMNDNQILRDRLSNIEANFKLQNDVMRVECENLFSENERLKSQMETYKDNPNKCVIKSNHIGDDDTDSSSTQDHQYKVRYLQHEVTKLMEEKTEIQDENANLKKELQSLKESAEELACRINSLLNEKTKLQTQCNTIKEELESNLSNHIAEMDNCRFQFSEEMSSQVKQFEEKIDKMKTELQEDHRQKYQFKCKEYEEKIEQNRKAWYKKELELSTSLVEKEEESERMKQENEDQLSLIIADYEKKLADSASAMDVLEKNHCAEIDRLKQTNEQLQSSLDYAQEELKLSAKKNQKMLKDVRKQLEKEVRLTIETQSKLEEVVSSGSQNSQSKIGEYLASGNYRASSNADDQSSLYSSNNGLAVDMQYTPALANSVAMTDDEFKNLLDRYTNIQNDLCESKRYIEALCHDKNELAKTIEKQQNIIFNYIKSRGGSGNDLSAESPTHINSTSEALILNGMISSSHSSNFGIQSLVNQVKDSLKTISKSDSFPFGEKSTCRVTTAELKQLQRVCEELTMRCLNLETDLQLALDLNIKLNAQLRSV